MLLERFWTSLTTVLGWLTLSTFSGDDARQQALGLQDEMAADISTLMGASPIFYPPGGSPHTNFTCDYTRMGPGWKSCSRPENRACWLRHTDGREFNINTDFEKHTPMGIDRYYTLFVNDS